MNQIYIFKLYQNKFRGDDTKTYQIFGVPIGNAKITRKVQFRPAGTVIKYHQKTSNSNCLRSLASAFQFIGDNSSIPSILNSNEKPLTLQIENYRNKIHFYNAIMTNRRKLKLNRT